MLFQLASRFTNEFWFDTDRMQLAHGADYIAFRLFSLPHLAGLILSVIVSAAGYQILKRRSEQTRRKVLLVLAILIAAEELTKDIILIATEQFSVANLPFHICGVNIFTCLWYALRPNKTAAEHLYGMCLPGAWVALITTSWQSLPPRNYFHLHSVVFHILLAAFPIWMMSGGFRPHPKNIWKVYLILLITAIPGFILNHFYDTNFMFLHRTDGNPILQTIMDGMGPLYPLGVILFAFSGILLMYVPWIFYYAWKRLRTARA